MSNLAANVEAMTERAGEDQIVDDCLVSPPERFRKLNNLPPRSLCTVWKVFGWPNRELSICLQKSAFHQVDALLEPEIS
jgi:hypothetical protein